MTRAAIALLALLLSSSAFAQTVPPPPDGPPPLNPNYLQLAPALQMPAAGHSTGAVVNAYAGDINGINVITITLNGVLMQSCPGIVGAMTTCTVTLTWTPNTGNHTIQANSATKSGMMLQAGTIFYH